MTYSYFFPFTFLATLNTSTPKTKTGTKPSKKEDTKKAEKKESVQEKAARDSRDSKPKAPSQIPKKTSPKKSLVPVKEETLLKDVKKANSK